MVDKLKNMKSKVAVIKCTSYQLSEVQAALQRGVELIGGIDELIGQQERILLKPNMLMAKSPEKAVTSHPVIFEALINLLNKSGYKNLFYGDSPGFGSPEKVAQVTGMKKVADDNNIPLLEFSRGEKISFLEGHVSKQFEIAEAVLNTDAIVSISKMKAHQLTKITGAIKNQLGCVFGFNKGMFHSRFPSAIDFSKMLIDLNLYLKPRLFIMDGIVAMEGNGPTSGDPVKMNVLLVSKDPVALDTVFCRLIDIDPKYIPTIIYGEQYGLGNYQDDRIEIVGDELKSLKNSAFNIKRAAVKDESLDFIPGLKSLFLRKPYIVSDKCINCGACIEACPVEGKALAFKDVSKPPVYDYSKCIRCYCCQEMCPQKAIEVKTPLLGKWLLYK